MSQYMELIKKQATRLHLSWLSNNVAALLEEAEKKSPSYDELIHHLLAFEIAYSGVISTTFSGATGATYSGAIGTTC